MPPLSKRCIRWHSTLTDFYDAYFQTLEICLFLLFNDSDSCLSGSWRSAFFTRYYFKNAWSLHGHAEFRRQKLNLFKNNVIDVQNHKYSFFSKIWHFRAFLKLSLYGFSPLTVVDVVSLPSDVQLSACVRNGLSGGSVPDNRQSLLASYGPVKAAERRQTISVRIHITLETEPSWPDRGYRFWLFDPSNWLDWQLLR